MTSLTHLVQKKVLFRKLCLWPAAARIFVIVLLVNMSVTHADITQADEKEGESELAAIVNGVQIKIADLAPQVHASLRKYGKYGVQKNDVELLKALRMQALEKLISAELVYQEARKITVKDLDKRVAEKMKESLQQLEENEDFDKQKLKDNLTKQILVDEYLTQKKIKDSEVSESAVKEFYEKNKQSFMAKEAVRTRHILVSVAEDATPEEKAEAKKKIEEARKLVTDGKSFEEVAKEYSDCNSAPAGGELGYNEKGYMPEKYDEVAASLEPGKLSDVIETDFGYHVLEVLGHRKTGVLPYEEVKEFIAKYLNNQFRRDAMTAHISELRKKAKVDIYL